MSKHPHARFLDAAVSYANAMIEFGRDRYGPGRSPLFASAMDRNTLTLLPDRREVPLPAIPGTRDCDRVSDGANVFVDQGLFKLLYALSPATGDDRYARAADEALGWFFSHCQSPATGLMAWGEHVGWDFRREARYDQPGSAYNTDMHEFTENWDLWDTTYRLNPSAAFRLAQGLWHHQIADQALGLFSRHSKYSRHEPEKGMEFPRHGSYYITAWTEAYCRSSDEAFRKEMLTAIDTIVTTYLNRRKPNGALPAGTAPNFNRLYWAQNNLECAIQLDLDRPRLPAALADKMHNLSQSIDAVFLGLPHEVHPGGRGFGVTALSETLEIGDPGEGIPWSQMWHKSYGAFTTADLGLLCLDRCRLLPAGPSHGRYRALAIAAADLYCISEPDSSQVLFPWTFADAIDLLIRIHKLTGEERYRARAESIASRAMDLFLDSSSPLPRASNVSAHYETITGADDLMLALFHLSQA